ncbi:MAG: hypothetical protein JWM93_521 [Frankiales bacterium]|nr:hypothetical protein [Frankiales bacterium]
MKRRLLVAVTALGLLTACESSPPITPTGESSTGASSTSVTGRSPSPAASATGSSPTAVATPTGWPPADFTALIDEATGKAIIDEVAGKWVMQGFTPCPRSMTNGCLDMDVIARDGCRTVQIEIEARDASKKTFATMKATATGPHVGQTARLTFAVPKRQAASRRVSKVTCL